MNAETKKQKLRQIELIEKLEVEISNDAKRLHPRDMLLFYSVRMIKALAQEMKLPVFELRNALEFDVCFTNTVQGREHASQLRGNLIAPKGLIWRCAICLKTAELRFGPSGQGDWDESCILRSQLALLEVTQQEDEARRWVRTVSCWTAYTARGCKRTFDIRRDDVFRSELVHEGAVDECQEVLCPHCNHVLTLDKEQQYHLRDEETLPTIEQWAKAHSLRYEHGRLFPGGKKR